MPGNTIARSAKPLGMQASLQVVFREALRRGSGRVALRVTGMAPYRRRVARALLQEGALAAGGIVVEGNQDDLLLVGAEAGRAKRLCQLLERLLGPSATEVWSLDRDAETVLAYAASEAGRTTASGSVAPSLASLDAWLRTLPLSRVARREVGVRVRRPGDTPAPAFLRLSIARRQVAGLLGDLGADSDLLEHAVRSLAGRLLLALGDPAQRGDLLGDRVPGALHLPVPPALTGARKERVSSAGSALVATIGLEAAGDPGDLARRRANLAAQGWLLEVEGLDAASLMIMAPEWIPADWLRLAWSPMLASAAATAALRRIDPERIILSGVEDQAGFGWAERTGITRLEGSFARCLAEARRHPVTTAPLSVMARAGHAAAQPAA